MRKGLKDKKSYRSAIFVYEQRRLALRLKYGMRNDEYSKRAKRLTDKIKKYKLAIRRIEARDKKILEIDYLVKEFLGVSAYKTINNKDKKVILARQIFVRYCMENGIKGSYIKSHIGCVDSHTPYMNRLRLIRKAQKNPDISNLWRQFNQFVKDAA